MFYEEIVSIIKRVTGLDVPVYFNDIEATGSPYFGLGEHAWDIMPKEFIDCAFCDVDDFIDNKHLHYYHIGLPDEILKKNEEYIYKVTSEQLKQSGIKIRLTKLLMETFIILHEFGHAHQLYIAYGGDVEKYLCDTLGNSQSNSYNIRADGLAGTEKGLRKHKELSTEKYADSFALKYFKQVAELVK